MSAVIERDLMTGGPVELAEVAVIRKNLGHDWRVCVKDAGNGPCIDVREYVTEDAYRPEDSRAVGGSASKPRRNTRDCYVGPTKAGLWLTIEQALAIGDALSAAIDAAEIFGRDDAA